MSSRRDYENSSFICEHCGAEVSKLRNGSFRNHCPYCLFSKHLDNVPGDRASNCGALMEPVALRHHGKKGYQIAHRCITCGKIQWNKIAENTDGSDSIDILVQLSTR